jgi:hypothetical protein
VASVRRVLAVTAGLAAAGFVVGAVLGGIVVGAALVMSGLAPWESDVALSWAGAAAMGGLLGMLLGPIAAWLLMRHVPIGRALGETALGTAIGSLLGLLLASSIGLFIPIPPLTLALVGFAAAAVRLRVTHRKKDAVVVLPPEE